MSNVRELSERAALTQNERRLAGERSVEVRSVGHGITVSLLYLLRGYTIIHSATRYDHHIRTARSTLRD